MLEAQNVTVQNNSELPAGYRLTELGPLPEEWQVVGFHECVIRIARVPKVKKSEYRNIGLVPIIDQGQSFIAGYTDGIAPYEHELPAIVFGDHTRVFKLIDFPFVAGADGTQVLVPNLRLFDPMFLYYAFLKLDIPSRGYNRHLSLLREEKVPLPPVPEQRAIARVLRTVQEAKEATARVIAAARELKKSLMRHLFTYGPVPADQTDHVPMHETELGPLPAHWQVVRLAEVTEKPQYGYTASATEERIGPKFLRITDIQNDQVQWHAVPFCAIENKDLERYRLRERDMLFARIGATTGKTYLVTNPPEAVFASYLIRVRANPKLLSPHYFYFFTQTVTYWQQVNAAKGGRLKQGINIPVLTSMQAPLPHLTEQLEIARILRAVDEKILAEKARKAALEGLFRSLLHHLMSARIRLPHEFVSQFKEIDLHEQPAFQKS